MAQAFNITYEDQPGFASGVPDASGVPGRASILLSLEAVQDPTFANGSGVVVGRKAFLDLSTILNASGIVDPAYITLVRVDGVGTELATVSCKLTLQETLRDSYVTYDQIPSFVTYVLDPFGEDPELKLTAGNSYKVKFEDTAMPEIWVEAQIPS